MIKTVIDCKNLTKTQINRAIKIKTRGLDSIELRIYNYKYDDLAGLTLPNSLLEFNCPGNKITSFAGLTLP
jgi:hypothetical protein